MVLSCVLHMKHERFMSPRAMNACVNLQRHLNEVAVVCVGNATACHSMPGPDPSLLLIVMMRVALTSRTL
jgi:hypothetical protein